MKTKMLALYLTLTVVSWAQTATQNEPAAPQQSTAPAEKGSCPCCDKMAKADATGAPACCARHAHAAQSGETASCCAGKDAKSCCGDAKSCMRKDDKKGCAECKDQAAGNCCGGQCGKDCSKGDCCSSMKTAKTASSCCNRAVRAQDEAPHAFSEPGK